MGAISRAWSKNIDQWRALISKAAAAHGIPEAWIAGVMLQESGGTQRALSPVGAVGLMQIMPSTPSQVFHENISAADLWKPEVNVDTGARLLAQLAGELGWNVVHVAASYNAGGVYPYSGSASSCTHDGLWHVRENCGYCEQVVRGINAAIDAGYSGTGANAQPSASHPVLSAIAGMALVLVPFAALMWLGYIQPPAFARGLVPRRNPYRASWKDYIRGEWWVDAQGEPIFADQDVGDVGHEAIAVDAMLSKDALIDGLIDRYQAEGDEDSEAKIDELEDMRENEYGASEVYFNYQIPDEVGIAAAGSEEKWNDVEHDARLAYAKYEGAIQVVDKDFTAYRITSDTIEAMQSFILGQAEFEDVDDNTTEITIEQIEPSKSVTLRVSDFLTLKDPRVLWSLS
jgi:hypothetical protein